MKSKSGADIMAKKKTYDDRVVVFWTDGVVTGGFPYTPIKGSGKPPRYTFKRQQYIDAAWLLAGEVGMYDWHELPAALKAAKQAVSEKSQLGPRHSVITRFRYLMTKAGSR